MTNFNTVLYWREYALGTRKGGAGGIGEVAPFAAAMSNYDQSAWNANNIINGWGTADFMRMSEDRMNYTGERVTETIGDPAPAAFIASFGPVKKGAFINPADGVAHDVRVIHVDLTEEYFDIDDNQPVTPSMTAYMRGQDAANVQPANMEGQFLGRKVSAYTPVAGDRVAYVYDNAYIPAEQIPSVVMRMQKRPVQAKIRRINYMFSKLAAWEAQNEYGFNLQAEMAQQAAAEIEYETDCEIIDLLTAMGDANVNARLIHDGKYQFGGYGDIVWIDEELDTIGYSVKAEGFLRKIAQAKAKIYEQTGRFLPNWALVSPLMTSILQFCPGYKAASTTNVNGAYKAGTLDGMDIYVSPRLTGKVMYLGVLGKEADTAAAIYMPFLPITPSQLLEFPDDSTVQGMVTVYGLERLNEQLVCKIRVVEGNGSARVNIFAGAEYSEGNPRP